MSGNRNKLKKGLVITALLTTFFGYGFEKSQVQTLDVLTKQFDAWAHKLCKGQPDKATLLAELKVIVEKLEALMQSIPDTPPANLLIKNFILRLNTTYETFSKAKSFIDLGKSGGASCELSPMLEKASEDLNNLIAHIEANPATYDADALHALKQYRQTTFKQFFDYWHPKDWKHFFMGVMKLFKR